MSATNLTRRTLLVDGNNLLVRATYAAKYSHSRMNAGGVPTAALHIFIGMLTKYVRLEKPDRVIVCWDGGKSAHRLALFADYKGNRAAPPEEDAQDRPFAQAKEFLTLAGVHHVEHPGVEADDLIAAYWRRKSSTERVTIVSGDKDFLQLLDGWTEQLRPGADEERWTASRVRADLGCKPEHLPYVMALTGDDGDGVPGIKGIGPKTAVKLLAAADWSLERLLAWEPPLRLVGREDEVRLYLSLVDLRRPIPGITVTDIPPFRPTDVTSLAYPLLDGFLTRYDLDHVRSQIAQGTLWQEDRNP